MVTNAPPVNALVLAEKLRRLIEVHPFPEAGQVTCSFGIAELSKDDTMDHLTQRADRALYRAKAKGRNRIESD